MEFSQVYEDDESLTAIGVDDDTISDVTMPYS